MGVYKHLIFNSVLILSITECRGIHLDMDEGKSFCVFFVFIAVVVYCLILVDICICNSTGRSEIWDKYH